MKTQAALAVLTVAAVATCSAALVVARHGDATCGSSTHNTLMASLWLVGGALAWAVLLASATLRRRYWWACFTAGVGCLVLELFSIGGLVAWCI